MSEKSNLIKYHGLVSLFIGVGFLVVTQASAGQRFDYYAAVPFFKLWLWFVLYVAAVAIYNRWYLTQIGKNNIWKIIKFSLLLIAGLGLFLVVPTAFTRGIFLIISIPIIAFFEATIGDFSENFLVTETLFSALGAFAGFGGWAFLYTPQARFYLASAVFLYVFLLARSFFEYAPTGDKPKLISALAIAFLSAEIFWASGFLPQHFAAVAIALTAILYSGLIINYHYLFNNLDYKKIQFHLLIAAVCIALAFISTPWDIIN